MANYEDTKPEHVIGKTIEEARFGKDMIEIKFTDGTEFDVSIRYWGYGGSELDSNYWPKDTDPTESPSDSGSRIGGSYE